MVLMPLVLFLDSQVFEGKYKLQFHMASPLLPRKKDADGRPKKMTFGGWMYPVLKLVAKFKVLRGSCLDPIGYTAERKLERALISDYRS